MLPLEGTTVVDFSRYLPGPFCTLQLAWLGARVTVVEQPPHGDPLRALPPLGEDGVSLAYRSLRAHARVEQLDLQDEAGRARALELCREADVVVEGFRPGVAERLGIGHAAVAGVRPDVVYCSLSGWGQDGPWAQAPGHDLTYLAVAGLLDGSGEAGRAPHPPPVPLADLAGGSLAATAISACLARRARTGEGARLDVSLAEAAVALQAFTMAGGEERGGGMLTGAAPWYGTYRCADGGFVAIAPLEPQFFVRLCERLGLEELAPHQHDAARADELRARLAEAFATRTAAEWERELEGTAGGDCCVARVRTPAEAADAAPFAARGATVPVPGGGGPHMPASPFVLDGSRTEPPAASG